MWTKVVNLESTLFPLLKETLRVEELSSKEATLIKILDFAEIEKNITVLSVKFHQVIPFLAKLKAVA